MVVEKLHLKDYYEFLGQDGKDPTLTLYLPYNMKEMGRENAKRPTVIVCPGGGYGNCSEREDEPIGLQFLRQGFNVFILNYSVQPHRFPTQLCEVAAVMELIYKNAEKWNCDTQKIAIIGFSAGGHLAAHYSNAYNCDEVRAFFPESKSVNATILSYPVITADEQFSHKGSFLNLLGHTPNSEEIEKFSCEKLVSDKTPKTFIWHTAEDTVVPVENSLLYAKALSEKKVPYELHIYPFGPHGMSTSDSLTIDDVTDVAKYNHVWLSQLERWLKATFEL